MSDIINHSYSVGAYKQFQGNILNNELYNHRTILNIRKLEEFPSIISYSISSYKYKEYNIDTLPITVNDILKPYGVSVFEGGSTLHAFTVKKSCGDS